MEINDKTSVQNPAKKERIRQTNLRDEYFAERSRIIEQHGDLEMIRISLGLNRRQLCRLLLVDPSAWTRWVRTNAPPHLYQALRWLLELRGIRPDVVGPANLSTRLDEIQSRMQAKIQDLERHIEMLERTLALTRVVVTQQAERRPRATKRAQAIKHTKRRRSSKKVQFQSKRHRPVTLKKHPGTRVKRKAAHTNKNGGRKRRRY